MSKSDRKSGLRSQQSLGWPLNSLAFIKPKSLSHYVQKSATCPCHKTAHLRYLFPTNREFCVILLCLLIGKGKTVPLQAWSGPEGSRKLRFPDSMTTAQGDGKVVSLMHRPHLPPGNSPGTHFC